MTRERVAITGSAGYIGSLLCEAFAPHAEVFRLSRAAGYELSRVERIAGWLDELAPEVILHCANYGNLQACAASPEASSVVNVEATRAIAEYARQRQAYLVFLSSDYVFDGERGSYTELDAPEPRNQFGRTKLEAERAIAELCPERALVLRTSGVYGRSASKPCAWDTWAIRRLSAGLSVDAFSEIYNTPTFIGDLVEGIEACVARRVAGVFHLAGPERMSRLEFARELGKWLGAPPELVRAAPQRAHENFFRPRDVSLVNGPILTWVGAPRPLARALPLCGYGP